MRGKGLFAVLMVVALLLTAGCTNNEPTPSPSPTVMESPTPVASPETSPSASPAAGADVFKMVGEEATITVGSTKLSQGAYYTSEGEDSMSFPLLEVAKALGWTATEPSAEGIVEIRMTRDGMEEVNLKYTRPERGEDAKLTDVSVRKGGKTVDMPKDSAAFINGHVYVTEALIDKALQEIDMRYDGAKSITIEAKV